MKMQFPKQRLLIVDDEEELAKALERVLVLEGYDTMSVTCPLKAMEIIKHQKIHIVLTDIVMPGMDGIDLLIAIRNFDPLVQVIMMTGYSTMDKTMQCLEQGAIDYLFKPFSSFDEVVEAVKLAEVKLNRWQISMRRNFG
jgi:DNA-binding NtrC family response regulator